MILRARIYFLIYVGVVGLALWERSILPLMFIGLPTIYGSWLMPVYGYTQHAGLAENVLDHRLNCRTVHMNFINRYLYWNMNYHIEHHMFPLVPYHNLPRLHEIVKPDMPAPYRVSGPLARNHSRCRSAGERSGLFREAQVAHADAARRSAARRAHFHGQRPAWTAGLKFAPAIS